LLLTLCIENSVERPDAKEVGVGNPAEENDRTLDEC